MNSRHKRRDKKTKTVMMIFNNFNVLPMVKAAKRALQVSSI